MPITYEQAGATYDDARYAYDGNEPVAPAHTARVVNRVTGAVIAQLPNAQPETTTESLNEPGVATLVMSRYDPDIANVIPYERDIQILVGNDLVFWGTPQRPGASSRDAAVRFTCNDGMWHFAHRLIGKADRNNILVNPDFEDASLSPWTAVNTTATQDTTWKKTGTKSLKLVQSTANQVAYMKQRISNYQATGVGSLLTIVVWFRIQNTGWIGEAVNKRGLGITRFPAGGGTAEIQSSIFEIDGQTPRDSDQRAEATIWMPPNAIEDIEIRLYSVGGTIWYDTANLVLMESIGFPGQDQATTCGEIVAHLQSTTYGKDNLGIVTDCPVTGVTRDVVFQFADHIPGDEALSNFTRIANGVDHAVIATPTTRTYTTYFPKKGVHRATLPVNETTVSSWDYPSEGQPPRTRVITLGEGDGPDREEGYAANTTAHGGLALEEVTAAPTGMEIRELDEYAAEHLRTGLNPRVLNVTVPYDGKWSVVAVGDTLPVSIVDGFFPELGGNWRVVERTIDHIAGALSFQMEPE